jgi:phage-related protein (TIGR01555 family)
MFLADRFVNALSGLGTERDKSSYGQFQFHRQLLKTEIEAIYRSSWLGGTIIDAKCDDMTRQWRRWHAGTRQESAILAAERKFHVQTKINLALKMARLYGGSALLIGDGAPDPSKPLDVEKVRRGGLKYLHVLSRWEMWSASIQRDPLDEFYGEPEYYMLNATEKGGVQIHPSRVIRFIGIPILELSWSYDGWGFSIYERVHEEIRNVTAAAGNMATMTYEGKLDVIKIPNLTNNVQSMDYRNKLTTRFSAANLNKSVHNALILDSEEEWDQKEINLSNMPEGIRTLLEICAGAANMPVTRLLGTSPKGLNATGHTELRNYYDHLSGEQEVDLRPRLERLDQVLVRHALGSYPADIHYEWLPLWQMTEAEAAVIALQKAQSSQIYATGGFMPPSALRKAVQTQLVQDKTYPGLQEALDEFKDETPEPLVLKTNELANEIDTPGATARLAKTDSKD